MTGPTRMSADVVMSGCADSPARASAGALAAIFSIQIVVVVGKFHTAFAPDTVLPILAIGLGSCTILVHLAGYRGGARSPGMVTSRTRNVGFWWVGLVNERLI